MGSKQVSFVERSSLSQWVHSHTNGTEKIFSGKLLLFCPHLSLVLINGGHIRSHLFHLFLYQRHLILDERRNILGTRTKNLCSRPKFLTDCKILRQKCSFEYLDDFFVKSFQLLFIQNRDLLISNIELLHLRSLWYFTMLDKIDRMSGHFNFHMHCTLQV